MRETETEEPVEQLHRALREAGFSVTASQRHRWEQAGLLPKPRQRGLGQGRGTKVVYPAGSAEQIVALCKHRGNKRRSLKALAWDLWWDGYPLADPAQGWVRGFFREEGVFLEKLAAGDFKERDDFVDALEESSRIRLAHPLASRLRRRTGRVNFSTLLKFLMETSTGTAPEFDDEQDAKIAAKLPGVATPKDAQAALRLTAFLLDPRKRRAALDSASMEDLGRARDEIREVLQLVDAANALAAAAMGRTLGPLLMRSLTQPSHREGPGLVVFWLSMMCLPGARQTYEAALSVVRDVAKGVLSPAEALEADLTPGPIDHNSEESFNE